jgi:hypothetical protein
VAKKTLNLFIKHLIRSLNFNCRIGFIFPVFLIFEIKAVNLKEKYSKSGAAHARKALAFSGKNTITDRNRKIKMSIYN